MPKDHQQRPSDALFEYACSLLAADQPQAAVTEFEALHDSYPDEMRILFMLGGAYFEAKRFADAAACMEAVVAHKPTYELSSLLLFHSLWHLGREAEAIAEMHRFLGVADSSDYKGIRDELEKIDGA